LFGSIEAVRDEQREGIFFYTLNCEKVITFKNVRGSLRYRFEAIRIGNSDCGRIPRLNAPEGYPEGAQGRFAPYFQYI